MAMVVPVGSKQKTISAEAAYMVWGFGAAATVAPWDDESLLFLGTSPQLEAEDDTSGALIAQAGLLPLRRGRGGRLGRTDLWLARLARSAS